MSADKKNLRAMRFAAIDALSAEYIASSDAGILENLVSLPEFVRARTIFTYYSIGREPDTHRLIERALRLGKRVALPVSLPRGVMKAVECRDVTALVPGRNNIPEPADTGPETAREELDFIVVPAVSYSRAGYRLGYGGGYYDRFLAGGAVFTAGLAREELLLDNVPVEAHDASVSCLVTETCVRRF
ncbi:MAG: 5-formyltetrahydrofolate cyclo-ligase [Oscillospiraceae bacterium]|jgi:5-formyltetrahydrofolate cyclo-ligase|nr:5-formyltetrahydrofolate cyclo-ligase [Oscillospiraceae bacterium]